MAIKSKAGLADRYQLSFKLTIFFFHVCVCGHWNVILRLQRYLPGSQGVGVGMFALGKKKQIGPHLTNPTSDHGLHCILG